MVKTVPVFPGQRPWTTGMSRGPAVLGAVSPFAPPRTVEAAAADRREEGCR